MSIQFWRMSIQLNGINCYYGAHQALFDITLECPAGETLVLLGPSGAGKSSLLRVLNLLEMPRSGQLQIAGNQFDFRQAPGEKAIRELRQNVGMVFQQYNLWPHLTVVQNLIEAPCRVLGLTKAQAMEPQVLLFDEPTAALDPEITAQIVSIIRELAGTGITQVIVTHEVEVARKTASRVVYMENGHVVEQGDSSHFTQPRTTEFANYLSH